MGIIETLQAEIQSLKERVTALEQLAKGSDAPAAASRQLTRDDIIEMAKRDIEKLKRNWYGERRYIFKNYVCDVKFFVNREKRTTVAILKHKYEGVVSRGIAKCHPDDCFNAHIGRAIALRRALGLEVPDEYLNAPQPTEVRVGDIIRNKYTGWTHRVTHENWRGFIYEGFDIIDDTREEV
jgi:hypothetical protein